MNKCCKANFWLILVLLTVKVTAQVPLMPSYMYISQHLEEATTQMVNYKIPASVILAQAIFESNSGNSALAKKSNNHFGIKCHLEWGGDTITKTDDTLNECFRKYNSIEDSYTDHSMFLKSRSRYAHLFNLNITDYKGWCYGLKNAGYATYSCYTEELIKIIETHKLYALDRAESIEAAVFRDFKTYELKHSNLKDFEKNYYPNCNIDLLFSNEKDILVQSINMMVDQFEEDEESDIAGNN
ncbi:MAG: glucosaminidase domain-containing protein [Bacteroidota bacterium]|nr:glucosaminidase domain-containing protein [Bacteroidota bacterium]